MALYRYVGNKDGLVDLMADTVHELLTVSRGHGWRPALRGLGESGWRRVQAHPWFARLAFSRPPLGPRALDAYESALAELEPLGLEAATRMGFVSTVMAHVLGSGLALLEERRMRSGASDADLAALAEPYLSRIAAAGAHPHFSRWAADPGRFEQTLEWLLDGLEGSL